MSDDPFATQGDALKVTLKGGKGYEEPWLVIRGRDTEETKRRVAEAVGLEGTEDLTLVETIISAKNVMQGASNVASKLGGTAIPQRQAHAEKIDEELRSPAPEEEPAGPTLEERIQAIETKREGQQLYLNNRAEIDADPEGLKAKMMAKMKSL